MGPDLQNEIRPYNGDVMAGRPPTKEAPLFGHRLATLRRSKGLTQTQLAERLNTTRKMIDYYERRADNPSLEFIQHAARVLGVPAGELIGSEPVNTRNRPGPPSQLQVRIDKVKQLPRKEQEFVIKFLDTVIERSGLQ